MIDVQLNDEAKTLTIEWNNRELAGKSHLLVVILTVFWLFALGLFVGAIWVLATDQNIGHPVLMWFAIAISAVFIAVIPLRILNRFSRERVECSEQLFRFYSVEYPWLFPTKWRTEKITGVTIGHNANSQGTRETMVTLNVWLGWRRSMLGYWLDDDMKYRMYEVLARYFKLIGRNVPFTEDYDENSIGPPDSED